jgi:hypothetical protein
VSKNAQEKVGRVAAEAEADSHGGGVRRCTILNYTSLMQFWG